MSAFDLAEWTTIVPEVRYGGNAMTLPYNLRLLMVMLIAMMSLLPQRRFSWGWFSCVALALAAVIGLLPPFEYFIDPGTGFREDVNYNQLMNVALIGLGVAAVGLSGFVWGFKRIIFPLVIAVAIMLALSASGEALGYMRRYIPDVQIGLGVLLFCGCLGLLGASFIVWESKEGV